MTSIKERNLIDHPGPGDRWEWDGKIVNVCSAPITVVPGGYRAPISVWIDGEHQIWMRSPWLKMHKAKPKLLRTAEQFLKEIEASGRNSLSILE